MADYSANGLENGYRESFHFYRSMDGGLLDADFYEDEDDYGRFPKMDTIYESFEELQADSSDENSTEAVATTLGSTSDQTSSSSEGRETIASTSTPDHSRAETIRARRDSTLSTIVTVVVEGRRFRHHRLALISRSGFFKRVLQDLREVELPDDLPGGAEAFEMVASFCYGSSILIEPTNVATLRCCAEYLEMTEDNGIGNLCERTELYLTQVVLQSWRDTVVVLQQCFSLLPISDELLIVSKCIDTLSFMACMDLVESESMHSSRLNTPKARRIQLWNDMNNSTKELCWWIDDLIDLPFNFFGRIVASIRRQGMEEKHVSKAIIRYMEKWIIQDFYRTEATTGEKETCYTDRRFRNDQRILLESIVRLLPLERFVVPVTILFALLQCALALDASMECRLQLETRIASQLELATINDFLLPLKGSKSKCSCISGAHVQSMQEIVSMFMAQQQTLIDNSEILVLHKDQAGQSAYTSMATSTVAKVWDEYLTEVAYDPNLSANRFADLVEIIPSHARADHDYLYKAIHVYLKSHPHITHSERLTICKPLNCQKLSHEVCIHAVQNELMPLRTIVQAMFMQQLQARLNADTENVASSGYLTPLSSRRVTSHRFQTEQNPFFYQRTPDEDGTPLGFILQRDAAFREAVFLKDDFEATKNRLRELEHELVQMKRNMQPEIGRGSESSLSKGSRESLGTITDSGSVNEEVGQSRKKAVGSCIGQMWQAQWAGIRFGQKLARTFQRLGLGSFWKSDKPAKICPRGTPGSSHEAPELSTPSRELCSGEDDGPSLRVNSVRADDAEEPNNSSSKRHSRHHSFS